MKLLEWSKFSSSKVFVRQRHQQEKLHCVMKRRKSEIIRSTTTCPQILVWCCRSYLLASSSPSPGGGQPRARCCRECPPPTSLSMHKTPAILWCDSYRLSPMCEASDLCQVTRPTLTLTLSSSPRCDSHSSGLLCSCLSANLLVTSRIQNNVANSKGQGLGWVLAESWRIVCESDS